MLTHGFITSLDKVEPEVFKHIGITPRLFR